VNPDRAELQRGLDQASDALVHHYERAERLAADLAAARAENQRLRDERDGARNRAGDLAQLNLALRDAQAEQLAQLRAKATPQDLASDVAHILDHLPRTRITPDTITQSIIDHWYRREERYRTDIAALTAERDTARAESEQLRALRDWLISLDEPDSTDRRTVTLNRIIARARASTAPAAGGEE
jgi:chromosome segregation ATPase